MLHLFLLFLLLVVVIVIRILLVCTFLAFGRRFLFLFLGEVANPALGRGLVALVAFGWCSLSSGGGGGGGGGGAVVGLALER